MASSVLSPDTEEDALTGARNNSTNEFMKTQDEEGME
jgi:hypothetical protein